MRYDLSPAVKPNPAAAPISPVTTGLQTIDQPKPACRSTKARPTPARAPITVDSKRRVMTSVQNESAGMGSGVRTPSSTYEVHKEERANCSGQDRCQETLVRGAVIQDHAVLLPPGPVPPHADRAVGGGNDVGPEGGTLKPPAASADGASRSVVGRRLEVPRRGALANPIMNTSDRARQAGRSSGKSTSRSPACSSSPRRPVPAGPWSPCRRPCPQAPRS